MLIDESMVERLGGLNTYLPPALPNFVAVPEPPIPPPEAVATQGPSNPEPLPHVRKRRPATGPRKLPWIAYPIRWVSWVMVVGGYKINIAGKFLYSKAHLAPSFLKAHAFGYVNPLTYRSRKKICSLCPFVSMSKGRLYCKKNSGCGCGETKVNALGYRDSLSGWACPDKRFGYGAVARVWYYFFPKRAK